MPDRVLVTGVSGFLGGHIALRLLTAGHRVRGSVRDPGKAEAVRTTLGRHGADLERLELVVLDLLDDAGWDEAMQDVRCLQHVASPLPVVAPHDRDELLRPAVEGTERALGAALAADVERIVLTSSVAAVTYGHPRGRTAPFTETDWSATAGGEVTAYSESKTRAELAAWAVMEAAGRRSDLVTINPALVLGPLLGDGPAPSTELVLRLLDGSIPALADFHFGIVDVRDIAELHLRAMLDPRAGGHRYLAAAGTCTLTELAAVLCGAFPEYAERVPRFPLPAWAVRLYALFDRRLGEHASALGIRRELECGPAQRLLGRPFIPPRIAAAATAQSLIAAGLLPAAARARLGRKRG